ncbi:MAG: response regulator [Cytophagaceae bacterium]|nr:response regulator [Cytophagaceae bacterium]
MKQQINLILVAEDDPDDRLLLREAFEESTLDNPLHFVDDGVELIEYLVQCVQGTMVFPILILLNINMPRVNGFQALERIKNHPQLRSIPTAMLSTSSNPEMISQAYHLGANSYFTKPTTYQQMLDLAEAIRLCWLQHPQIPLTETENKVEVDDHNS